MMAAGVQYPAVGTCRECKGDTWRIRLQAERNTPDAPGGLVKGVLFVCVACGERSVLNLTAPARMTPVDRNEGVYDRRFF